MTNFADTTYTISETATKLDISEKTLRRWEEAGRFTPSRTLGNQRRYSTEDLQILDAIKHNIISSQKELLTSTAAAQFLGITEMSLVRLVSEGKLHPFITVTQKLYPRHRLLPLLDALQPKPQNSAPTTSPPPLTPPLTSDAPHLSTKLSATPIAQRSLPANQYSLLIANLIITLSLLTLYHFLTRPTLTPTSPSTPTGEVQGAATNPTLSILDDMLDSATGGLTATTITSKLGTITPNLTLLPGVAPTSPFPGSLYYDATENTIKIYTQSGWQNLMTTQDLNRLQYELESKTASPSTL